MERFYKLGARAYPWCFAVTMATVVFGPSRLGAAGLTTAVGLLIASVLLAVGVSARRTFDSALAAAMLAGLLAAGWFAFTSLRALNPSVSFVGMVGQHNGTAMLVFALAWTAASALYGSAVSLRWVTRVTAVAGGLFTVAALVETMLSGAERMQGRAAGFFDNSSSLGQFLGIAVIASVAWAVSARSKQESWAGWGLAGLSLVGIFASGSRLGLVAVVSAALIWAAVTYLPRSRRVTMAVSAVIAVAPLALTAALVAASLGKAGGALRAMVAAVGTDRDAIWSAAAAHISTSPLAGRGLQQFSAWITWGVQGGTPTTDPHNAVLAIVLGGGLIGAVLAGIAWVAGVWAVVRLATDARSHAVTLVASAPIALLASSLAGWTNPASLAASCALAGTALGVAAGRESKTPVRTELVVRWIVPILAGAALMSGAFVALSLPTQYALSRATAASDFEQLYDRWRDPAYAAQSIGAAIPALAAGDAQVAAATESLIERSANDTSWRVDLAASQMLAVQAIYRDDPAGFERFTRIAERGRSADPRSGLWDVLSATEADRLGLTQQAADHAERALAYDLDDETAAVMRSLVDR